MNKFKSFLFFIVFCFVGNSTKSGDVIIVNFCDHDTFKLFHMQTEPRQNKKSDKKFLGRIGDQEKKQSVLFFENVDFKKDQIWIAGDSWRRLLFKKHYQTLDMQSGNHVVFITSSRPGSMYGGEVSCFSVPLNHLQCMKPLYVRILEAHKKIIPAVETFSESSFNLKDLQRCKSFKRKLRLLVCVRSYYEKYEDKIDDFVNKFSWLEKNPDLTRVGDTKEITGHDLKKSGKKLLMPGKKKLKKSLVKQDQSLDGEENCWDDESVKSESFSSLPRSLYRDVVGTGVINEVKNKQLQEKLVQEMQKSQESLKKSFDNLSQLFDGDESYWGDESGKSEDLINLRHLPKLLYQQKVSAAAREYDKKKQQRELLKKHEGQEDSFTYVEKKYESDSEEWSDWGDDDSNEVYEINASTDSVKLSEVFGDALELSDEDSEHESEGLVEDMDLRNISSKQLLQKIRKPSKKEQFRISLQKIIQGRKKITSEEIAEKYDLEDIKMAVSFVTGQLKVAKKFKLISYLSNFKKQFQWAEAKKRKIRK